jgi:hypothetical protein
MTCYVAALLAVGLRLPATDVRRSSANRSATVVSFRPPWCDVSARRWVGWPGLALVVLSVVQQRLEAVRAILDGADVVEVAARLGVHRATLARLAVTRAVAAKGNWHR